MLSAIFGALSALPKFLDLVEKFASWLMIQIDVAKKNQARKDLEQGGDQAKQQKDTSGLDQLFDPNKKK